jgi:hypothetical protein
MRAPVQQDDGIGMGDFRKTKMGKQIPVFDSRVDQKIFYPVCKGVCDQFADQRIQQGLPPIDRIKGKALQYIFRPAAL